MQKARVRKRLKRLRASLWLSKRRLQCCSHRVRSCVTSCRIELLRDPTSVEPDFSDANWVMEWEYLPTEYINAVYGQKDGEQVRSVYEPTHVLQGGSGGGIEDTVNNFKLIPDSGTELKLLVWLQQCLNAFKAAQYTKVWYVWDKTTRRVLMFADNNWTWPIWVWDDPLKLPRFFPYFQLWFHESVNSNSPKGEVTYYLINRIRSTRSTLRLSVVVSGLDVMSSLIRTRFTGRC
jgi:hypothetical protein